jgi:glutathione S-transferase
VDLNDPGGKPIHLMESGAILLYLASKTGKFLPKSARAKFEVLEWLMFQMGGVGPMLGQAHHFRRRRRSSAEKPIRLQILLSTHGFAHGKTKALIGRITQR